MKDGVVCSYEFTEGNLFFFPFGKELKYNREIDVEKEKGREVSIHRAI